MGELRNGLVARAGDAVIAVGGEFGTLSEIAFALKLGRPVVGLRSWELARAGEPVDAIVAANTPAEAVTRALELAGA
jgi:predicted Rossmann-fold nucleotide-binding protein